MEKKVQTEVKKLETQVNELENEIQTLDIVLERLNGKFAEAFKAETQTRLAEIDLERESLKTLSAEYRVKYLKTPCHS